MSKYLCADCVSKEQCNGEWTTNCASYVPKEHKQTNEEYLRSCTTEELVKMILDLCDDRPCFACGIGYCGDENWCHVYSDEAREFVSKWLKQPHTIKE